MNDLRDGSEDRAERSALDDFLEWKRAFFERVNGQLAARLARMGVPPSDRDDLIAEAWARTVKHRRCFVGDDLAPRLQCWLMKTIYRLALDRQRRRAKHSCQALAAGQEEPTDERAATLVETAEMREWINVLVEKAPPGSELSERLFCEHLFHEISVSELAKRFGMTADAVDCRIRRRLRMLREAAEVSFA